MTHQTAEQVKEDLIEHMGQEVGEVFFLLKQELFQIYVQWNEYMEAFGIKEERVNMLNQAAGGFFKCVQDALWLNVILGLCRVTDPAKIGKNQNLSIDGLSHLIEHELCTQMKQHIDAVNDKIKFARDWRNRRYAHSDLGLAKDKTATPLEPASRKDVIDALDTIVSVMNEVEYHYMKCTTLYSEAKNHQNVVALLSVLDDGFRFDKERKEQMKLGSFSAKYIRSKDL
jgi:hypothetical protein